eukprot:COSAG04_NODE_10330_length_786_cov_1.241630_1_plen_257_part_10
MLAQSAPYGSLLESETSALRGRIGTLRAALSAMESLQGSSDISAVSTALAMYDGFPGECAAVRASLQSLLAKLEEEEKARCLEWSPWLSCYKLSFSYGGATATNAWYYDDMEFLVTASQPAALVEVDRGGGAGGFALAAVVEALPDASGLDGLFSFGVGRAMPEEGELFGWDDADGTCGLWQVADSESNRGAGTKGFGRHHDDTWFGRPIVEGSRLALHLSPRGAEGTRTARFFVDKEEVAVFVDIEDDGGDSDWVA